MTKYFAFRDWILRKNTTITNHSTNRLTINQNPFANKFFFSLYWVCHVEGEGNYFIITTKLYKKITNLI